MELLWIGLQNMFFRSVTDLEELRRYGRYPWWWRLRAEMARHYWFDSPFAVVRRDGALSQRSDDELIWGETPCCTLEDIFRRLDVRPQDVFSDLGCGRGLTVLFATLRFGVRARGYEILPGFGHKAEAISTSLGLSAPAVEWHVGDFLQAELSDCTVALLAWTTFPDTVRATATALLEQLPVGARVAALTHPVTRPDFLLLGKDRLRFSWGYATVYLYLKT